MNDLGLITGLIGLIAGTLSVVAFVPQILRIRIRKSASDISLAMCVVIMLSNVL